MTDDVQPNPDELDPAASPSEEIDTSDTKETDSSSSPPKGEPVFGRFAFWICAFPLILYLVLMMSGGYLESMRQAYITGKLDDPHHGEGNRPPSAEVDIEDVEVDPDERFLFGLLPLAKDSYPYTYVFSIAVTTVIVLLVSWGYFKIPFRVSWLGFVVGVIGVVVWIALAELDRNYLGMGTWLGGEREAFNPFEKLKDDQTWRTQFIAVRFFGLVCLVPLIEEFFVRAFLIRYVDDPDWDLIPMGQATIKGWIAPTIYGVVAHMTEPLAALAWFSMVTVLYKRTGNVWDCVVAHAVTNLLLGLYVVKFEAWYLW